MLDVTNISLSSLLTVNTQDTESEELPGFTDDLQQDDDSLIDPGAFVLFFAEATAIQPKHESNLPDSIESETPVAQVNDIQNNIIESQSIQEQQTTSAESTASLDDNVAVAWINSAYYQAEINGEQESSEIALSSNTPQMESTPSVAESQNQIENEPNFIKNENSVLLPETFEVTAQEVNESQIEIPALNSLASEVSSEDIDSDEDFSMNKPIQNQSVQINKESLLKSHVKPVAMNTNESLPEESSFGETNTNEADNAMPTAFNQLFKMTQTSGDDAIEPIATPVLAVSQNTQQTSGIRNDAFTSKLSEVPHTLNIPTDVEHPQWSSQFSDQVVWLSQQGMKNAVIKLHPEALGPLEISIKMTDDSAAVNIISHSQQIREVIEQSLPRLQEMMTEHGLSLSEVNIDSNETKRQHDQQSGESAHEVVTTELDEETLEIPVKTKAAPQGLVDFFA